MATDIVCRVCGGPTPVCLEQERTGKVWYCRVCTVACEPTAFTCNCCGAARPKETYPVTHGLVGNIQKPGMGSIPSVAELLAREAEQESKGTDTGYGPIFVPAMGPVDRPAVLRAMLNHRIDLYHTLIMFVNPEDGKLFTKPRTVSARPATLAAIEKEAALRYPDTAFESLTQEQRKEVVAVAVTKQLYGRLYETTKRLSEAAKVVSTAQPKSKPVDTEIVFSGASSAGHRGQSKSSKPTQVESKTPAKDEPKPLDPKLCCVCYSAWDKDTIKVKMKNCGHENACIDCFMTYLGKKIKESDVLPYLGCLVPGCGMCLAADDLLVDLKQLTPDLLLDLARVHLSKMLSREWDWAWCTGTWSGVKCGGGLLLKPDEPHRMETCAACGTRVRFKRPEQELDEMTKKMLDEGLLRPCPKCRTYTVKEKGICNVIQCAGCNIWWNWRTRQTGNSSTELKNKARMDGTLWEPGELEYQMQLQRKDPEAFKALLERNGMVYDPNYRRGT